MGVSKSRQVVGMNVQESYAAKKVSGQELVGMMRPGNIVQVSIFYSQPEGALKAISQYGKDIQPLYISMVHAMGPWQAMGQPGKIVLSGFLGPFERATQKLFHNVYFTPIQFTDGQKLTQQHNKFDFFIHRGAPMDERGYFNCSTTASWEYRSMKWLRANSPNTKIVIEANPNMPRVTGIPEFGGNEVHISEIDYVLEDATPLADFTTPPPGERENKIAEIIAQLVENRSTIQLGFGNLPMAIGRKLSGHRELGIHTEMFCESHVDLIEAGAVTNSHKGIYDGISIATFALGEKRLRDFVHENKEFAIVPVEEVNDVRVVSRNKRMVSINSVLMVDMAGQACAHCIGTQTYSGVGGAFEFAYGAQMSEGGKAIACMPSTTKLKDGKVVSNVVFRYEAGTRITIPEHSVDWVVTEFGAARLKLLNMDERAAAMIELAHPNFREELSRQARDSGLRIDTLSNLRSAPSSFFLRPS